MLYVHLVQETNTNTHTKNQTICEQPPLANVTGLKGMNVAAVVPRGLDSSEGPQLAFIRAEKRGGRNYKKERTPLVT